MRIPHEQIVACLRQRKWKFKRRGRFVEIWKHPTSTQRLTIPYNRSCDLRQAQTILAQAGFSAPEIDAFLKAAEKT